MAYAQDSKIYLTIQEKANNQPLEMVIVRAIDPDLIVRTNKDGVADISEMKTSKSIEIRLFGYQTIVSSFLELQRVGFQVEMTSSTLEMEPMVVSATNWSQSAKEVPSKITIISARDAALQNSQTAADLLGNSGEVFIQKSQQGGGSPMIRGFSTNRLLYSLDGVRMNTAIFRGGNIQNVISLDPFAIENTEVLFGSGSVIYGSDAIGAVMSFRTLTPKLSTMDETYVQGKALARFSSANNEKTTHFDANVGWKKWAILSSFSYSDFGDLRMGTHGPDEYLRRFYVQRIDSIDQVVENEDPLVQKPTGYTQSNFMQKVMFAPNKKWNIQYGFHYSETSAYSRYDRLIELSNGIPRSAVWNYGPQKWMMNLLTIEHRGQNKMYDYLSIRAGLQHFEESRIDRNFSGGNRFRLRTQKENVVAYSLNADFEKRVGRNRFFYGLEGVQNDVTSRGSAYHIVTGADIPVADRYPASTWSSYAAYFNYQRALNEKWNIQAGTRFSVFALSADFTRNLDFFPYDFTTSSLQNNALTGSLGAVYSPTKSWRISVNASTGFRSPNVDDMGKLFDLGANEIVVPNTKLEAEYAYNGELNISKIFGDFVKLDVTGFYTQLENALVRRAFQVNGQDSMLYDGNMSKIFAIQNAAFGNVYGFNLGLEIRLSKSFSLLSRYNIQKGVEEMDNGDIDPSRHAAPNYGLTRLTFRDKNLTMQLYAMYTAEVKHEDLNPEEQAKTSIYAIDADGNSYSPSWYTLNFKASYQMKNGLTVNAGMENITNQRYRPYSSGLVAAGRNLVFSVQANF